MKHKDYGLEYRRLVIGGVAILIVVIYIIRLFTLQITSDDYKKSADSNAFLKKIEYPSRGVISDRNGKLMVYNQLEDARGKVSLQVNQYEKKIAEADSRLQMALKNMENAEENLRVANIGFNEGVVESSLVLAAQTAWLQAHSEEIDARIDRIMATVYLRQATGQLKSNKENE